MSVSVVKPPEPVQLDRSETKAELAKPVSISNELLREVRVSLEVRLGNAPMTVDEMMKLKSGSIVTLESSLADHVELFLNGTLVARGEIVAVGDKYGVRIIDIAPASTR
jgi:flagellar motor switch protein FliN/FliY